MKLLTFTLIIVLLTISSAKPFGRGRHADADIADKDLMHGWLDRNNLWSWHYAESSSDKVSSESLESMDSSESSENESSEESSVEVLITDQTTPAVTTTAMMTVTSGDGSNLTPEPDTLSTDMPIVMASTPLPATPATPVAATSPGDVTHCVTDVIPTAVPITDNRGDN